MAKKNHFNGRTMHIDISRRFYQKGDSGVAFKIIPTKKHKGMVLSGKLKRGLRRGLNVKKDYARLYAICVFYLIKEDLDSFDNLVICNDELYGRTKKYLDNLFKESKKYISKNITSISELRKIAGDPKIRSYADNVANIYRKKVLKPSFKRQRGVQLDIVEINYGKIREKWEELNAK